MLNDIFKCFKPIHNDMTKLFHEGKARIDKKLDMVKIINDIQYLKILLNNSELFQADFCRIKNTFGGACACSSSIRLAGNVAWLPMMICGSNGCNCD